MVDISRDEVVNLFRFIDRMMTLPAELQRRLRDETTGIGLATIISA